MKQKTLLLFIFWFGLGFGQKAKIQPEKIDFLSLKASGYFGQDHFGNNYFVTGNVLYKKGVNENVQYQNLAFGAISSVDLLNPLQVVLFYKPFNAVVLLDNQFNEIKTVQFNTPNTDFILAEAVALANQNQLWFFDANSSRIGLYNLEKDTVKWVSAFLSGGIKAYKSDYNMFYWIDNQNNIYATSLYGDAKTSGKIPNYDSILILDSNRVLFSKDNELFFYEVKKQEASKLEIFEKTFVNYFYKDGILTIFTNQGITYYKIKLE